MSESKTEKMSESKTEKTEVFTHDTVPTETDENREHKETKDALLKFLFTNPNTGERMDYEESRMMYG